MPDEKTNSLAYQAALLALHAAVGLWNGIGYAVMCRKGNGSGSSNMNFEDQPRQESAAVQCNRYEAIGKDKSMSIENFKKLNEACQIIQAASKNRRARWLERSKTLARMRARKAVIIQVMALHGAFQEIAITCTRFLALISLLSKT
ncbi:SabA family sialic acid-binding adhesin [Helicobacter acinonychis]|uniref:Outer membrane protein 14 1 n=1 Tax=Helicobacter acinonychis (strain Sheeba) TaxID=382638 RepID=Q17WE8_HELAH|nr:outer membrane protein 14 fragment 1 [Helicobacter acinonychis str. Sheeba]CAK00028.1 outer membrane protein 20 fragment 1 [Helicobacter acinonychis str. Sheeba]